MNIGKLYETTHRATERIFPNMEYRRAVRRLDCNIRFGSPSVIDHLTHPNLSLSDPMMGLAKACRRENKEPIAPPSNTTSNLGLIGRAKAAL